MKKLIIIAILSLSVISCGKDYVCYCDSQWGGTYIVDIETSNKDEARAECLSMSGCQFGIKEE